MASRGINKVILVGNLGADPEVRYMTNGEAVANLTLATSEVWKDKESGENKERTEWHRVVLYRRLAEIAGEYVKKGSKIYIEGKIKTRKWQDQAGQDRYTTEIIADELQMLDRASGDRASSEGASHSSFNTQQDPRASSFEGATSSSELNPASSKSFNDDIPF